MAAGQLPGFAGTAPSGASRTFQERGVRDLPPTAGARPQSVIDGDDRVHVTDSHELPWRMVCALEITGQHGGAVPGTGWLAGPRTIVTAGHCVFDPAQLAGFAFSIVARAGRNGASMPFPQATSTRVRTLQPWIDTADPAFDIGAITLDISLGTLVGFFAVAARDDLEGRLAHVSGYPSDPGGGVEQYHHRNRIIGVAGRRLFYDVDTSEGQSGAPVWTLDADGGPSLVIGVHAYGNDRTPPALQPANSATLVNAEVLEQIRQWVAEDGG